MSEINPKILVNQSDMQAPGQKVGPQDNAVGNAKGKLVPKQPKNGEGKKRVPTAAQRLYPQMKTSDGMDD